MLNLSMHVPFLDLRAQYVGLKSEIEQKIHTLFEEQRFILGSEVEECERAVADYCGTRYACGVSSGTDALMVSLISEGIGPGDEVITTPYTFFATAGSIARVGAKPVFVDIDHGTFNMNADAIESVVNDKTKAVIVVHLFGQMMDMRPVIDVAERHDLALIEDAAQAIGAMFDDRRAGSVGRYGCFSFYPGKNLGAAGDAGMVVTPDAKVVERMKKLRSHGAHPKYYHSMIGGNFRLDALQAAVINVKLQYLDDWIAKRQEIARFYDEFLKDCAEVTVPANHAQRHTYNSYVIRTKNRDELQSFLSDQGIQTQVYYPLPLHLQECFSYLELDSGAFPESIKASRESLAIPIYPELSEERQRHVVESIRAFHET